jgi:SPP1 gp7 family putative phage head morphogenesis protein
MATLVDRYGNPIVARAAGDGVPAFDKGFFAPQGGAKRFSPADVAEKPYERHIWTYACARVIAMNVSRLAPLLTELANPENQISDHPVLALLRKPNALMTYRTFRQVLALHLLLPQKRTAGGQVFIIAWNSMRDEPCDLTKGELPDELMPFSDEYITPMMEKNAVGGGRQRLIGWTWEAPGVPESKMNLPLESVIRIYLVNPYDILKGLSPLYAAQVSVDIDAKSDLFNTRLFETDGRVAGVLSTDEQLTDPQRKDNLKAWMRAHAGLGRASNIAMLDGGLKYQQVGLSLSDMQYTEQKEWSRDSVISAYGLNRIAIGQYEDVNYATIKEGRQILWTDVYQPIDEFILDAFTQSWIKFIDNGKYELASDYNNVGALLADLGPRATAVKTYTDAGAPFSLACRLAGVKLRSEDLKRWPYLEEKPERSGAAAFGTPSDSGKAGAGKEALVKPKGRAPISNDLDEPEVTQDAREKFGIEYVERVLKPAERNFLKSINRYFISQRNRILDKVDAWLQQVDGGKGLRLLTLRAAIPQGVTPSDFAADRVREMELLKQIYKPAAKEQVVLETAKLAEELGGLVSWNVTDARIDYYVGQRTNDLTNINTRTFEVVREGVQAAIEEAYKQEWTAKELAAEIKKNVQAVYRVRLGEELEPHGKFDLGGMSSSKTIARTEMGIIAGESRYDAFNIEGIEYQEWITYVDERTRESHIDMDGAVVKLGDKFSVGVRYPRDPMGPLGEIINCRCVAIAVEGGEQ